MSAYNKAKGSKFESDLESHCNDSGLHARRLPRAGAKDIGDVSITLNSRAVIVVEAKNVAKENMADFLRQAEVEAEHYEEKYKSATYPVVAVKARTKHVSQARVTMTLETLITLLHGEGIA
jgi:Holliday junction resolvase